eukprot:5866846-Pyramimonas_sp.AAC.1
MGFLLLADGAGKTVSQSDHLTSPPSLRLTQTHSDSLITQTHPSVIITHHSDSCIITQTHSSLRVIHHSDSRITQTHSDSF